MTLLIPNATTERAFVRLSESQRLAREGSATDSAKITRMIQEFSTAKVRELKAELELWQCCHWCCRAWCDKHDASNYVSMG